ncbi:esterase-like activity of phytase family protein [Stagnihabitans tardus]|uniref:Esterase-like activity of phytase family protein n=1 Tax=Stagnihabitans tardus TaxID=2699202 RepID=A0AAE4Y7Q9_9RHOB|nr:esterase-like activity of phytase family protein [Stagnihabitans tardus]NBZ86732.1 esterase-like activity of phytase family protein [Stagnihabitans tardus]
MRFRSLGRLILGLWLVGMQSSAGPLPAEGWLQSHDLKGLPGGGYSALHLSPDGLRGLVMTDKGGLMRLSLTRDAEGRITKVKAGRLEPILDTNGKPLRPGQNDTEGLAVAADGRLWISTEGTARVLAFDALGAVPQRMRRPMVFARFPPNTAFEALALSPQGELWLIPEAPLTPGLLPVYVWSGTDWEERHTLKADPFWLVADAAFDDRGRLYLLERLFAGPAGFASRLRRFDIGATEGEVILRTPLGAHDNLEGLSLWRDTEGLRASMVSDDNFLKVFRAELVEYRLPD